MSDKYIYGGRISSVRSAAGVSGILVKTTGGGFAFRVYTEDKSSFTDYVINHGDLAVTIGSRELAAFYSCGEDHALDHSPQVFGLKKHAE